MFLRVYNILISVGEVVNLIFLVASTLLSPLFNAFRPKTVKNVRNKIVLITGAGNGIGKELAIKFAQSGAVTVLWDINENGVKATAAIIQAMDAKTHYFVVDVSDEKQVESIAAQVRNKVGDIDILVNNAGIAPCEPFKELTNDKIRRVFDINVLAHFWTIKQFLPAMERNNSGHIVAIASSAGIMGSPYFTAYGASKHAVLGFMKSLYEEMDENSQIKLTTICPLGISGTNIDIPTKTRYPRLLPIMTLDFAVDNIFESIIREEELLILPYTFKWIYRFISIFPLKIASRIWKCLDYEVVPKGVYAPIGRAHYYDKVNRKSSNHTNGFIVRT